MKIIVLSGFTASAQFAYAINTVKLAEGFAKSMQQITLICTSGKPKK
jgi:hypothetical protein